MNIIELATGRLELQGGLFGGPYRFAILRSKDRNWDQPSVIGQLFEGSQSGIVASALSLVTNGVATALATYKTWCVLQIDHPCQCVSNSNFRDTGGTGGMFNAISRACIRRDSQLGQY